MKAKNWKHLRRREATAVIPGQPSKTIYIGACGACGTDNRQWTKNLNKVTCHVCLRLTPKRK